MIVFMCLWGNMGWNGSKWVKLAVKSGILELN